MRPNLKASIKVKESVNCIHFHNFVPNFALVGTKLGSLIGIQFDGQDYYSQELDKIQIEDLKVVK